MGKIVVRIVLLSILWVGVSGAEMRTWTSKKGDTIKAEYVSLFAGNKVYLKTSEGKTLKIPIAGLCAADQEYLAKVVPPTIEISVDVDQSTGNFHFNKFRQAETTKCSVIIKKTSKDPCSREFTAYAYMFAKQQRGHNLWLISNVEKQFSFKGSNEVELRCPSATVEFASGSNVDARGYQYEGYLVVVEDDAGQIVAVESNQAEYTKNLEKIKGEQKGAQFDRDFDLMSGRRSNSWTTH